MKKIIYKEPISVWWWLHTALNMEWRKYLAVKANPDLILKDEWSVQIWGYVVIGYSLIEQCLKAILFMRNTCPPKTHGLVELFHKLKDDDQQVIREYYRDFRCHFFEMNSFPFSTLDNFLSNLDGSQKNQTGSFNWRYFLIEEVNSAQLPEVSVNMMHEIAYGCVNLVHIIATCGKTEFASDNIYSRRLQMNRYLIMNDWIADRKKASGWGSEGNRIEIITGPREFDYFDYLVYTGEDIHHYFQPKPNKEEERFKMIKVIDKRKEMKLLYSQKAGQFSYVTGTMPEGYWHIKFGHVMFEASELTSSDIENQ